MFAGPWRCLVHNTTLGSVVSLKYQKKKSILSNQSLFCKNCHHPWQRGFHKHLMPWAGSGKISLDENKVWEQFWVRLQISVAFSVHFGHRSVSRQSVVRTGLPQCRDCWAIDVLDSNIRHQAGPIFCLLPPLTSFRSPSFIKACDAARSFHCKKAATGWTSSVSSGPGSWRVSSFPRSGVQHYHHQQHLRHHPQPAHTGYPYSPANIPVSRAVHLCFGESHVHVSSFVNLLWCVWNWGDTCEGWRAVTQEQMME